MLQQIFLGFIGLCSGFIIAGGLIGLLIGLSIVPRYAGITHTADHIMLYEDITLFGTELGNLFYLFQWNIPAGTPFFDFVRALFRNLSRRMDHGTCRNGRYFSHLCKKNPFPKGPLLYHFVCRIRQSSRLTDLLL